MPGAPGIAAVASTIGSVASTNIGDAFDAHQIDSITHKLLHGITGAVSGAIIDGKEGAVAGAFGAMAGEIIAETLLPTQGAAHDHASGNTEAEHDQTTHGADTQGTKASRTAAAPTKAKPTYTDARIAQVHGITRLVVATGALLAGMDEKGITAAVSACTTAIEHNHGATLRKREDSAAASAQNDAEEVEAAKTATHAANDATTKGDDIFNAELDNEIPDYATADGDFDGDSDVEDIGFVDQKGRFVPAKGYAPNSTSGSTPGSAHAAKESTRQSTTESYLGVDAARDDAFASLASASGRMSPTSRDFYYNSERAQTDMEQAILSGDQAAYDEAFARHTLWEQTYDDRQIAMQGARLLATDPKRVVKQAGYVLGGTLVGASVLATGGTAAVLGGAGAFTLEMTQRDCEVSTLTDALEVGASTALGTTAGMGVKAIFGTSAAVAGAGYMVDSTPMMMEGLVGVGLSGSLGAAAPMAQRIFGKTTALKATKAGGVIRADAIPAGLTGQKIGKSSIDTAVPKKVHGNSREYVGETHRYVIRDAEGNLYKTGESMRGVNKSGKSIRAETQRRKLERKTGDRYETEIRETFKNKDVARTNETKFIHKYREFFGSDKLPGNKGNR